MTRSFLLNDCDYNYNLEIRHVNNNTRFNVNEHQVLTFKKKSRLGTPSVTPTEMQPLNASIRYCEKTL